MPTNQGKRAVGGADTAIFRILHRWQFARALTEVLDYRGYAISWTPRGPVSDQPPRAMREWARRALREQLEKLSRMRLARRLGRRADPPKFVSFEEDHNPRITELSAEYFAALQVDELRVTAGASSLATNEEDLRVSSEGSKHTVIREAAQSIGVSRLTLYRLLHGKLHYVSWDTMRALYHWLQPWEWESVVFHLWSPKRRAEYESKVKSPRESLDKKDSDEHGGRS
jgi:hypothetical protein